MCIRDRASPERDGRPSFSLRNGRSPSRRGARSLREDEPRLCEDRPRSDPRSFERSSLLPRSFASSVDMTVLPGKCARICEMATQLWVAISVKEVRRCPTLPQGPPCSTIGAERLSFRVRNVTGRFPLAMAAETLLMFQKPTTIFIVVFPTVHREPLSGRKHQKRCVIKSSAY